MDVRSVLPVLVILTVLLSGCVAVPTDEQLAGFERYILAQTTAVAVEKATADAKTAQVAGTQSTAQPTPTGIAPSAVVTATAGVTITVTPALTATPRISPTITATAAPTASQAGVAITGTRVVTPVAAAAVTATVAITPTAAPAVAPTAASSPTPSPSPTRPPLPTATSLPTAAPTNTVTPLPTSAVPPSPTRQLTVTAVITAPGGLPPATVTFTTTPPVAAAITVTAGVTLEIRAASVNLRGGPGTEFDIITTVAQGQKYAVTGRNADASWWQVCCVNEKPVWVIDGLVAIQGERGKVPVRPPLMPDKLSATWMIHWLCFAEGCPQPECVGQSTAQTLQARDVRWLELKRQATWTDKCGKDEDWLLQVDRYTGQETQAMTDPPLFYMWMGANPGPENRTIEHFGRTLSLWCTDTRTREIPQTGGWTVLFEGKACYDRGAGILVMMDYTKRWLFTGTAGGQKYERKYFGDYEVYQQMLVDTNVPMSAK